MQNEDRACFRCLRKKMIVWDENFMKPWLGVIGLIWVAKTLGIFIKWYIRGKL